MVEEGNFYRFDTRFLLFPLLFSKSFGFVESCDWTGMNWFHTEMFSKLLLDYIGAA